MTKVNKTTDIAVLTQALPAVLSQPMVQVSSPDSRLPTFKTISPIEVDGTKIKPEHSYSFGFTNGDGFQPLEAGTVLTVLAGRDAVRRLVVEVGGQTVKCDFNNAEHKKADKKYEKLYKAVGQFNKTNEQYEAALKEGSWDTGSVYLVVALTKQGAMVGELPAFKTAASYWFKPLSQAIFNPSKLGVTLKIDNHACNVRAAKSDPTKKYLDPGKFNQWQIVELTQEQLGEIVGAVEAATTEIELWFQR
jgi:hypothetical protein